MKTTITGLFLDRQQATVAAARLAELGVPAGTLRFVDADTLDLAAQITDRCQDSRRALLLGILFGVFGGAIGGAFLGGASGGMVPAMLGALVVAVGGALLGLSIGRSTTSQIRAELEHHIAAGAVFVTMVTNAQDSRGPQAVLAPAGSPSIVSTSSTFRSEGL
jgi:hypothetical protein